MSFKEGDQLTKSRAFGGLHENERAMSVTYQVLNIESRTRNLRLATTDYSEDVCVQYLRNTTLTTGVFEYNSNTQDMTLYYGCRPLTNLPSLPRGLSSQCECEINGTGIVGYYVTRNITESSFGELANLISTNLGFVTTASPFQS